MRNVLAMLSRVESFLFSMRHSGTTSLLKTIAAENDVWVLVADEEHAREFGDKGISLGQIKMGLDSKPILFDNYTIMRLTAIGQDEILKLTEEVRHREELIFDIESKISRFRGKENLISKSL